MRRGIRERGECDIGLVVKIVLKVVGRRRRCFAVGNDNWFVGIAAVYDGYNRVVTAFLTPPESFGFKCFKILAINEWKVAFGVISCTCSINPITILFCDDMSSFIEDTDNTAGISIAVADTAVG